MKPRALLRRKGTPYDELGLDDPKLSDAALIAAMHEHPILIERPVVQTQKGTRLCRPPERVNENSVKRVWARRHGREQIARISAAMRRPGEASILKFLVG